MKTMDYSKLQQLGLGKNEAIVYASLFELGKVKAQAIIKHTKLHPNLVYPELKTLIEKRLVSKVLSKGILVFEANDPEALVRLMEEKKQRAQEVANEFKRRQVNKSRELSAYEGIEGVIETRNKALDELTLGDYFYVLGASHNTSNELKTYWKKFNKKMIAKGIDYRLLFDNQAEDNVLDERFLSIDIHARKLPFGVDTPMFVAFYKDTLNITVGTDDMITFSIRNQAAVDSFKKYFEYFWNLSQPDQAK